MHFVVASTASSHPVLWSLFWPNWPSLSHLYDLCLYKVTCAQGSSASHSSSVMFSKQFTFRRSRFSLADKWNHSGSITALRWFDIFWLFEISPSRRVFLNFWEVLPIRDVQMNEKIALTLRLKSSRQFSVVHEIS